MFSRIYGAVLFGLNGCLITVETDIANGLPSFDIVGLATVAVKEAKERVRTAVKNSGLAFPVRRITVNLAPAGRKKEPHWTCPLPWLYWYQADKLHRNHVKIPYLSGNCRWTVLSGRLSGFYPWSLLLKKGA